jgi:hypothetical protein
MDVLLKATHGGHVRRGVSKLLLPQRLSPAPWYTPKGQGQTETCLWRHKRGAEVHCSSTLSLTSALDDDEGLTAHPGRSSPLAPR